MDVKLEFLMAIINTSTNFNILNLQEPEEEEDVSSSQISELNGYLSKRKKVRITHLIFTFL
jgi:hypothetical protein